jgi:hypothetical protein
MISQIRQLPGGVTCSGLAWLIHRARWTKACKFESGKFGKQSARFCHRCIAFFILASSGIFVFLGRYAVEQQLGRRYARGVAFARPKHVTEHRQHIGCLELVGHVVGEFVLVSALKTQVSVALSINEAGGNVKDISH